MLEHTMKIVYFKSNMTMTDARGGCSCWSPLPESPLAFLKDMLNQIADRL